MCIQILHITPTTEIAYHQSKGPRYSYLGLFAGHWRLKIIPQPLAFEWTRELVSSIINALTLLNQFKSYHHQWHPPAKVSNTIIFDRNMEQFRRFSNQWKNWIWWNKSSDSRQICTSRKITSTISWEPFGNCIFSGPRSIGENKKYEGFDCWLLAKQFWSTKNIGTLSHS